MLCAYPECPDRFNWPTTDNKLEAPQEISKQCLTQKDEWLVSLSWQFPSGMVTDLDGHSQQVSSSNGTYH